MQVFRIHQELFGLEAKYRVFRDGEDELFMTLKGTEAIMRLYQGDEGQPKGSFRMKSILSDTKFEVFDEDERHVAFFEFPMFDFKKKFRLVIGESRFQGLGGLRGRTFRFHDEEGELALEIAKQSSFRDRYTLQVAESVPVAIAILATAVVDQKYFEHRG